MNPWIPNNPHLPAIPIKSSFGYGSQVPAGILRPLALQARPGTTDLKEVARSVNQAIKSSELRAQTSRAVREEAKASPAKKRESRESRERYDRHDRHATESPRRRRKREPTPDETQLHQALREATVSPTKDSNSQKSDPTPSPPVPRTVSTDSSPAGEPPSQRRLSVMSNSPNYPLYPSPLKRGGHGTHDIGSPDRRSRESSVDNASVVSWNLERDIHDDDLKRTRPSTHGRNITAPPRRPSGLANLVPDTIDEEEEEEEEEDDIDYFQQQAQEYMQKSREEDEEEEEALKSMSDHSISSGSDGSESELESEAEPKEEQPSDGEGGGWTTSVRTIIPSFFRTEPTLEPLEYLDPASPKSPKETLANGWASSAPMEVPMEVHSTFNPSWRPSPKHWARLVVILLVPLTLAVVFQTGALNKALDSIHLPSFPSSGYATNKNESAVVNRLRHQVSHMNDQMSSLSRELGSVRSQHAHESKPSSVISQPIGYGRPIPRLNFLSPGMGAMVDPGQTTPTSEHPVSYWKRVLLQLTRQEIRPMMPPKAALTPWEDVGDCWCTSPRDGVSQLSVLLGRDVVPEEVVVEHIPSGATLDPGVAPQEIELWARYRVIPLPSNDSSRSWMSWLNPWGYSKPHRPTEPTSSRAEGLGGYNIPGGESLHDVLMNTLSATNMYEPDSAFSDDPFLGPNFYRVGKMRYDIHREHYVQHFQVNTIIDIPTIRVDKVAFRIRSNWGSNNTCIYRFKLHGHV